MCYKWQQCLKLERKSSSYFYLFLEHVSQGSQTQLLTLQGQGSQNQWGKQVAQEWKLGRGWGQLAVSCSNLLQSRNKNSMLPPIWIFMSNPVVFKQRNQFKNTLKHIWPNKTHRGPILPVGHHFETLASNYILTQTFGGIQYVKSLAINNWWYSHVIANIWYLFDLEKLDSLPPPETLNQTCSLIHVFLLQSFPLVR